jgi:uncharacterized protein with von Willebrand factor type A (vWA) domain
LAAALVKDEDDRDAFDEVFDRFFSGGEDAPSRRRRKSAAGAEGGRGRGRGEGAGRSTTPPDDPRDRSGGARREVADRRREDAKPDARRQLSERRALARKPFRDLDPLEAERLPDLAAAIARRFRARLRRRLRRGKRGRLDFRRTLRKSVARGGAAIDLELRRRRPGRLDLVALCDVSGSVRHASEFFAALLEPCREYFRRVRLLVFVDRPVDASVEEGRLIPEETVDFHAFSDFGRTFVATEEALGGALGRNTILLVLGDARNNRRPARADALARMRSRVRAVWWLNPEAESRWGSGDSAIESYRPHVDVLLPASTPAELVAALARLTR